MWLSYFIYECLCKILELLPTRETHVGQGRMTCVALFSSSICIILSFSKLDLAFSFDYSDAEGKNGDKVDTQRYYTATIPPAPAAPRDKQPDAWD